MNKFLNNADLELFKFINSHRNAFWDEIMYQISTTNIWIPLYVYIIFILFKEFKKKGWICLAALITLIILSDKVSTFFKYFMKTLRPSHEIYLKSFIHLSKAGPGGLYGYVSSHASNFFSFTILLFMVLPKKYNWFKVVLLSCALLVAYSRIYNGVHYPFDVLRGMALGSFMGLVFGVILKYNKSINLPTIKD